MTSRYTRIVPVFSLLLAFTLIAGAASAQAPDQPRPQPGAQAPDQPRPQPGAPGQPGAPPQPGAPSAQAKPQEQIARGELASIDATAKMLTIKPAAGAEQKFQYSDATKVTGARGGVAGLATQSGKQVVVHFTSQGANRVATEIEVQEDKPGAAPKPGAGDRPGAPGGDSPGAPGGDKPGAPGGDKPGPGER
jgi:translation initiation factor IF-2